MVHEQNTDRESRLADVSTFSIEELMEIDNPVFLNSLNTVLQEENDSQAIVAGFQSAI